jgi:hypothetical protein
VKRWGGECFKLTETYRNSVIWFLLFLGFTTAFCSESDRGQPKMCWCLCCTGVSKWYEIACICHQTQGQHIQWTINSLLMTVSRFRVDPPVKFMTSYETQEYRRAKHTYCNLMQLIGYLAIVTSNLIFAMQCICCRFPDPARFRNAFWGRCGANKLSGEIYFEIS